MLVSYINEIRCSCSLKIRKALQTTSKEKKHKLAQELSDVVVICQSVSFKGFDHAKAHRQYKCQECVFKVNNCMM